MDDQVVLNIGRIDCLIDNRYALIMHFVLLLPFIIKIEAALVRCSRC